MTTLPRCVRGSAGGAWLWTLVARQGFLEGFNHILVVGAALALLGALLTALLVRASDLLVQQH